MGGGQQRRYDGDRGGDCRGTTETDAESARGRRQWGIDDRVERVEYLGVAENCVVGMVIETTDGWVIELAFADGRWRPILVVRDPEPELYEWLCANSAAGVPDSDLDRAQHTRVTPDTTAPESRKETQDRNDVTTDQGGPSLHVGEKAADVPDIIAGLQQECEEHPDPRFETVRGRLLDQGVSEADAERLIRHHEEVGDIFSPDGDHFRVV